MQMRQCRAPPGGPALATWHATPLCSALPAAAAAGRVASGSHCSTSSSSHRACGCSVLHPASGRRVSLQLLSASGKRGDHRGSKQSVATFPSVVPSQLLPSDLAEREQPKPSVPLTVYSCRFTTGHGRGAALSDPQASGVNICLIGKDGRTVMHRVSPVNDPQQARKEVERMCQVIGNDDVGADCPTALGQALQQPSSPPSSSSSSSSSSSYSLPPKPPASPRLRFQEGMVDEVVFLAPELGPLAGVLVGTEQATWVLEELQISSSRTHHVDRFICRKLLGSQPGQGATYLTPVPQGSVVYGTGEGQVTLTREQASALHALNMDAYSALKQRLITTTVILTVSGASVAGLAAGLEGAVPFALGGLAGVVYQWLLQQGVDSIVATTGAAGASSTTTAKNKPSRPEMRGVERPLRGTATIDDPTVFIDFVEVDTEGTIIMQQQQGKTAGQGNGGGSVAMGWVGDGSAGGMGGAAGAGGSSRHLLGSPMVRLAFVAAATALVLTMLAGGVVGGGGAGGAMPDSAAVAAAFPALPVMRRDQVWQLVVALLGFMTYKVALVSVSLSAPPQPDLVKAGVKASSSSGGH